MYPVPSFLLLWGFLEQCCRPSVGAPCVGQSAGAAGSAGEAPSTNGICHLSPSLQSNEICQSSDLCLVGAISVSF